MGDVGNLHPVPPRGETSFMTCPCRNGNESFIPIVLMQDPPVIVALVCPECESRISVNAGRVGEVQ